MPVRYSDGRNSQKSSGSHERYQPTRRTTKKATPEAFFTKERMKAALHWSCAAVVMGLTAGILFSPSMSIKKTSIYGLDSLPVAEAESIRAASKVPNLTNLVIGNVGSTLRKMEAVPSVDHVETLRKFPGEMVFKVYPRLPVATITTTDGTFSVDKSGVIIRQVAVSPSLPAINIAGMSGLKPGNAPQNLSFGSALRTITKPIAGNVVQVASIDIDQTGELCLNMVDHNVIRFGAADNAGTKSSLVRRIYEQRPGIGSEVSSIDVSVPEHPTCVPRSRSGSRTVEVVAVSEVHKGEHAGSKAL
ncbi:MAG: hypothetical protein ABJA67_00310 [Chthonomonadales bacterium]